MDLIVTESEELCLRTAMLDSKICASSSRLRELCLALSVEEPDGPPASAGATAPGVGATAPGVGATASAPPVPPASPANSAAVIRPWREGAAASSAVGAAAAPYPPSPHVKVDIGRSQVVLEAVEDEVVVNITSHFTVRAGGARRHRSQTRRLTDANSS